MKLVDLYGWSTRAMINRYVALGVACALCLIVLYGYGVISAHREALINDKTGYDRKRAHT